MTQLIYYKPIKNLKRCKMDIDSLVNTYGSYIYSYALKLSCDPHLAEDLAQETFIKAWKNSEQLVDNHALKAWLRKICLNSFLMHLRKEKKLAQISHEDIHTLENDGFLLETTFSEPTPEDEVLVDESIKELQNGCFLAMTRKLSLHQRMAFSLVDMFGLSIDETAKVLELSKSAVKGLLYRARMNLDSFFHSHCNLIHVNNPCNCKAWIGFVEQKNHLKNKSLRKQTAKTLDYTQSNYTFDTSVRNKIYLLYKNMPDKKPPMDWYNTITELIKKI